MERQTTPRELLQWLAHFKLNAEEEKEAADRAKRDAALNKGQ